MHPRLPYRAGEVVWAVRQEMARSLEDVLGRRWLALLLDACASFKIAPVVAQLMAVELGRATAWEQAQVSTFVKLTQGSLVT